MIFLNQFLINMRHKFGKSFARSFRKEGQIPSIIYGNKFKTLHVNVNAIDLQKLKKLKNEIFILKLLDSSYKVIIKKIDCHPFLDQIEHIDFLKVDNSDLIIVDIPIILEKDSIPGVIANLERNSLKIKVHAGSIPKNIKISLAKYSVGDHIHACDINLHDKVKLMSNPDTTIVNFVSKEELEKDDDNGDSKEIDTLNEDK